MIRLDPMTGSEFHQYLNQAVETYAEEHVLAGNWSVEESVSKATIEFENLLPEGEKTENNYLFTIRDKDKEVGMIWLARKRPNKGFIYDINIWDGFQGHGYGKEAMQQIEIVGRKLGLKKIGLRVFGHNKVTRGLYEKLGYQITNINMEKEI